MATRHMMPVPLGIASIVFLCYILGIGGMSHTHAAGARLHLACAPSGADQVACQLSGQGFAPAERLTISYIVTTKLGSGALQTATYRRYGVTDTQGSFLRPTFFFTLDANYPGYRLTTVVAGDSGDYASATVPPAAHPRLYFACAFTTTSEVACQLSGSNFAPKERVTIAYTVTAPGSDGVVRTTTYTRRGTTDGHGAFIRPTLSFDVQQDTRDYMVEVVVTGVDGEWVTADARSFAGF